MFQSTINEIKKNLLKVLDEVIESRQYLNKHFQNSMNNYFLENYATLPCLKKRFDTQSGRQVRKEIFEKYNEIQDRQGKAEGSLKCFLIMRGFIEEHKLNNSLNEYRSSLITLVKGYNSDNTIQQGSQEWISQQWRRLFALMVLHHTYYPEVQGVYELWYHVFDERLIARERQKKKKEEIVYKKGKIPYIIPGKVEENELSTSPLLNNKAICLTSTVSKNEDSFSSISSADDQQTECPFYSPKSSPSLLNLKNVKSGKRIVSYKQQSIKKEESFQDDAESPTLSKKRITQETIVIIREHSISQLDLCTSKSTSSSTNPILQNPNDESMNCVKLQKMNFDNQNQEQINQQQYHQQNQQMQFQQHQYNQTNFSSNNAFNTQYDNQSSFYQNTQSVTNTYSSSYNIDKKEEENMNIPQNQYQMQQYLTTGEQQYHNSTHQYQQHSFNYPFISQLQYEQSIGQSQRFHNNTYKTTYYDRQQSRNYQYDENNYNTFIPHPQQLINQCQVVGQNQNNTNIENNQDYYPSSNQENYMSQPYIQFNDDLNKLKYEQQSNPFTSHNLDHYAHNQCNPQVNTYQEQIQPQDQSKYYDQYNYEQSPYESSHSTYADQQMIESAHHSSNATSYSSMSSPVCDSINNENNDNINLNDSCNHQLFKVEYDQNAISQYQPSQYSYQNMNQYNQQNFCGADLIQEIYSTLKSEQN